MIYYNSRLQAFLLNGKKYSYAMFVNPHGILQTLHFGKRIEREDLNYLIEIMGKEGLPSVDDVNKDGAQNCLPLECGVFGHGDNHEPTVMIRRNDGAVMSRLRYVSHSVYDGAPNIKGMPHVRSAENDDGIKTLSVVMKDDCSSAEIILNYVVDDKSDALVKNVEIKNAGDEPITIEKAYSFCLCLPTGDYSLLRLTGRWSKEREPDIAPIAHGITKLASLSGASSHTMNPFMGILHDGCTENSGECYGIQLIYSGSYALTCDKTTNYPIRLQGGINDINFSWKLNGGETFVTPQTAIVYSDNGLGEMSRTYADFLRTRIMPPDRVYAKRPIVINNWEATYYDFNNEKLYKIIDEASKIGVDTFVLDDGWFGDRKDESTSLGDWVVNEKKLKGGLNLVIDYCKNRGMKFGIWLEPEMLSEDSELYRAHPDYAVYKKGEIFTKSRCQIVLDMSRPEVVDYIYGVIEELLSKHDVSYVKWDMNRGLSEYFSYGLSSDRQGEFTHRYMLGVYNLAERLIDRFPDIFFEGCAGGCGRYDAGMMYYFSQIWTSDDTDAYERTKIQWGTSTCYPLSVMSCHVSACPNHQTGRITPFKTRGDIASLGAFGYELDLSKLTEEEKAAAKEQIAQYKETEELILRGDLYRLSNPFTSKYFCESVVSKDKTEAYVVGMRIHSVPSDFNNPVCLAGLDEENTYYIKELDMTASGKALMAKGLMMPAGLGDFISWRWHLRAI